MDNVKAARGHRDCSAPRWTSGKGRALGAVAADGVAVPAGGPGRCTGLELLHPQGDGRGWRSRSIADISQRVAGDRRCGCIELDIKDPWDFEEVYTTLHDFAAGYPFDTANEEYLVHITTGTHVAQICLFLLTESRHLPARSPDQPGVPRARTPAGTYAVIDLDLSRYDKIASPLFARSTTTTSLSVLKSGIETRNAGVQPADREIEHVAIHSTEPILLMGPTGAGKSQLARESSN